jgi:hypothetical protein
MQGRQGQKRQLLNPPSSTHRLEYPRHPTCPLASAPTKDSKCAWKKAVSFVRTRAHRRSPTRAGARACHARGGTGERLQPPPNTRSHTSSATVRAVVVTGSASRLLRPQHAANARKSSTSLDAARLPGPCRFVGRRQRPAPVRQRQPPAVCGGTCWKRCTNHSESAGNRLVSETPPPVACRHGGTSAPG